MRIRDVTAADLETMLAINQANVPALGAETPETLQRILEWSEIAIGVDVDDTLVGFCLVLVPDQPYPSTNYLWFQERYTDFIYLDRVGFAVGHRGKGHGAALYAAVKERVRTFDRQPTWFTLEVNIDPPNEGSMRFHQRQGFTEVGRQMTPSGKLVSLLAKKLR